MKGVMSLLLVLILSSLVVAGATSTTNTNFNVVADTSSDGYVSAVDESVVASSVEEGMNYSLYWIALVIVLAIIFVFWKLNKRDISKQRAKARKKSKKKSKKK